MIEAESIPILGTAQRELSQFPWDSESELVELKLADIKRVLQAYAEGRCGEDFVERWADAVEGRDDIGYELMHNLRMKEILFQLSNPDIEGRLTKAAARNLLQKI